MERQHQNKPPRFGRRTFGSGPDRPAGKVDQPWGGDMDSNRTFGDRQFGSTNRGETGAPSVSSADERIEQEIRNCLKAELGEDGSNVKVRVAARRVALSGTVSRAEDRDMLGDLCERIMGVEEVDNRIRVSGAPFRNEGEA